MKMKRISTILLALLMLISFTACNLDNNGILYRGPNRTPSDNKNRNYIGQSSDTIYFVTSDGLSQAKLNGNTLTDDQVISSNSIFQHYFQGHGWFDSNSNSIVWLEDNQGEQNYYLITPNGDSVTTNKLEVKYSTGTTELKNPTYLYRYYSNDDTPYLVVKADDDSNAAIYTATVDSEAKTLTLTQMLNMDTSFDSSEDLDFIYSGSVNGLLWSTTTSKDDSGNETTTTTYMYALPNNENTSHTAVTVTFSHDVTSEDETTPTEKAVTVDPSTIKSVYEKDGNLFVLTSSSSRITIYSNYGQSGSTEGTSLTLKEINSVSASYNSAFPIYYREGKLIFLDYNISDSSVMYFVNLTGEKETTSDSLSSGIEAEAFIDLTGDKDDDTIYLMTKNHGFFKVSLSGNSVSEI